ncbi:MAG TPA: hypothetical protein VFE50_23300 [Cyclobacteriaceae bacterium]|nr:hypothetical protein [Cyclobacteriaceae bacterium]
MNATPGIPRTSFKPSSYTNYVEEMEKITRHIYSTINHAKKLRAIDVELWGKSLKNDHRNLAHCCALTDEISSARQFYHNATRLDVLLADMVRTNLFPKLPIKGKLPAFHTRFVDGFPEALLANDEQLLITFAKSLESADKPQSDNRFTWFVTSALRSHILGDNIKAKEHVLQAHKLEFFRLQWKGFSHALLGIIERDPYMLNEGIELRLRAHKTTEFKSIYYEYSEEATAIARLAIRAGLRPNIQSPFINRKLLTGNERTIDHSVDELIESLGEANDRKGNPLWFLKRLF